MNKSDIEHIVKDFFVNELEFDAETISREARLKEDIGVDSLDYVDIAVMVEEQLNFRMKPEERRSITTFGELCDYIAKNVIDHE